MRKTKLKPATWPDGTGNIGDFAFCVHHEGPIIERLTEPAQNRIGYINEHKPMHERPVRLAAFMPVDRADLPRSFLKAWDRSRALSDRARVLWGKGDLLTAKSKARYRVWRCWDKANALCSKSNALEKQAIRAHEDELIAIFHTKCPGVTFRKGYGLVFPEAK